MSGRVHSTHTKSESNTSKQTQQATKLKTPSQQEATTTTEIKNKFNHSYQINMSSLSLHNRRAMATERRLGLPRPSLESMRTTTNNNASSSAPPPAETDDDDYDDGYDSYDEEEALLSRRHGEAMEDNSGNKKRSATTTEEDIANEYAAQDQQQKKKKRKVSSQRTVTPEDLIKSKGLMVLRHSIAPKFHTTAANGKPRYNKTVGGMAKYTRHLVQAYTNWMDDMTNGIPIEEAMWKVYTLQSKTNVKQYVDEMRQSVRNDYVERTLGLEKAQSLLAQLEDYYQQSQYDDDVNEYDQEQQEQQQEQEHYPEDDNDNDRDTPEQQQRGGRETSNSTSNDQHLEGTAPTASSDIGVTSNENNKEGADVDATTTLLLLRPLRLKWNLVSRITTV